MQRIWKYIYLGWAVMCLATGYRLLAPGHAANFKGLSLSRSDFVMFFLFWCIAPLAITALNYGLFGIEMKFLRPSLDRSPFGRHDILQFFRLGLVSLVLMQVGACFALPKADHGGAMFFWMSAASTAGFFIGERLVYLVYAKKIIKSAEQVTPADS